jgi:hypothetical protein
LYIQNGNYFPAPDIAPVELKLSAGLISLPGHADSPQRNPPLYILNAHGVSCRALNSWENAIGEIRDWGAFHQSCFEGDDLVERAIILKRNPFQTNL